MSELIELLSKSPLIFPATCFFPRQFGYPGWLPSIFGDSIIPNAMDYVA